VPDRSLYRTIFDALVEGNENILPEVVDHAEDLTETIMRAIKEFRLEFQVSHEQVKKLTENRMAQTLGGIMWRAQPSDLKERAYRKVAEELTVVGLNVEPSPPLGCGPVEAFVQALLNADRQYCAKHEAATPMDEGRLRRLAQETVAPHMQAQRHLGIRS
jgi:hypothetical protein